MVNVRTLASAARATVPFVVARRTLRRQAVRRVLRAGVPPARIPVPTPRHSPRTGFPTTVRVGERVVAADDLLVAARVPVTQPSRPYAGAAGAALRLLPGRGDPRVACRLAAVAELLDVTPQALAGMPYDDAWSLAGLLRDLDGGPGAGRRTVTAPGVAGHRPAA